MSSPVRKRPGALYTPPNMFKRDQAKYPPRLNTPGYGAWWPSVYDTAKAAAEHFGYYRKYRKYFDYVNPDYYERQARYYLDPREKPFTKYMRLRQYAIQKRIRKKTKFQSYAGKPKRYDSSYARPFKYRKQCYCRNRFGFHPYKTCHCVSNYRKRSHRRYF
jgi:hypothetical protein